MAAVLRNPLENAHPPHLEAERQEMAAELEKQTPSPWDLDLWEEIRKVMQGPVDAIYSPYSSTYLNVFGLLPALICPSTQEMMHGVDRCLSVSRFPNTLWSTRSLVCIAFRSWMVFIFMDFPRARLPKHFCRCSCYDCCCSCSCYSCYCCCSRHCTLLAAVEGVLTWKVGGVGGEGH